MSWKSAGGIFVVLFACVSACALLAAYLLGVRPEGIDDAYIFMVYAQNLVAGEGFVYYPGGERVEGFSSLAWVLLLAALEWLGLLTPEALFVVSALIASVGLTALTVALIELLHYARQPVALVLLVWLAWLVASPGWHLWNVAAFMDIVLWSSLLSVAIALFIRLELAEQPVSPWEPALLLVGMVLTRPESGLWVPFFLASWWLLSRSKGWSVLPLVVIPGIAAAVTALMLIAFRLMYFGYPAPNTYYAKVSGDVLFNLAAGSAYIGDFLTGAGLGGLLWLLAAGLLLVRLPFVIGLAVGVQQQRNSIQIIAAFLAGALVAAMVVAMWVGGDHFGSFRLFQPLYPATFIFGICLWLSVGRSIPGMPAAKTLVVTLLAFALFALPIRGSWYKINRTHMVTDFELVREGIAKAEAIQSLLEQGKVSAMPTIGSINAGGLKYGWRGSVFDLLGLNDVGMAHANTERVGKHAHAAFDTDEFLRRPPEIMLPYLEGWPAVNENCADIYTPGSAYWNWLDGLQGDSRFVEQYTFVFTPSGTTRLCMYVRNDYLEKLMQVLPDRLLIKDAGDTSGTSGAEL